MFLIKEKRSTDNIFKKRKENRFTILRMDFYASYNQDFEKVMISALIY